MPANPEDLSPSEGERLQDKPDRDTTILLEIVAERERQLEKWGPQEHSVDRWLVILMEEVGEACVAAFKGDWVNFRDELIQVAAVAVAIASGIG